MIIFFFILILISIAVYVFLHRPQFGQVSVNYDQPKQLPSHFRQGKFQNLTTTPMLAEGSSYFKVIQEYIFKKSKRNNPGTTLQSKKSNLFELSGDVLVWMGHSTYFIRIDGKSILVDPVLSGSASPVKFTTKSYPGSDIYNTDEIPDIDFLIITHDHWDHLDYDTIKKLKPKIKKVITGLGVGGHLKKWGYAAEQIIETQWYEEVNLSEGFIVNSVPARHFSGRGLQRNRTLWCSFVLKTPTMKLYLGGDSGYDKHFAAIGATHGPFDLAILECGQYNHHWKYIHMMPEEVVQAAIDLKADKFMIVHWAKFSLSLHDWDEPIIRILEEAKEKNQSLIHPMIGETVFLKNMIAGNQWWNTMQQ